MSGLLIVSALASILAYGFFVYTRWLQSFPASLPWIGLRNEPLSRLRASLRQWIKSNETIIDGYNKHSIHGESFAMPEPTLRVQVMLPQEHVKWLIDQPEQEVSMLAARVDRNDLKHLKMIIGAEATGAFLGSIVGNSLSASKVGGFQAEMFDETRLQVDRLMGLDVDTWKELNIYKTFEPVMRQVACRVLFGTSLSTDANFMYSWNVFTDLLGLGILTIGQLPHTLRPFLGFIIRIPMNIYKRRVGNTLTKLITQKMEEVAQTGTDPAIRHHGDFISEGVKRAAKAKDKTYTSVAHLVEQFLLLSFAGTAPATTTANNILLDVLSSDPKLKLYEALQQEAAEHLKSPEDWEDPASLRKLVLMDGCIRESLRMTPTLVRSLVREVVAKDGVVLPDGVTAPHKSFLGIPVMNIHKDPRFYPDAETFNPYRYANSGDEAADNLKGGVTEEATTNLSAAHISDKFLSFGLGKHACPGRWFIIQQLKLHLAYIILNYDIQSIDSRPKNGVVGDAIIPAPGNMKFRRRQQI